MVRTYKRALGTRRYKDYSDQTLERAIIKIKAGRMSYTEASDSFNIPRRTLVNKVKGKHKGSIGAPQLISPQIERGIVDVIIASSEYGCPLSMMDLRMVMKNHLDKEGVKLRKFKNNTPGIDWCLNFIKRHKHLLSNRNCQNIKKSRAQKTETEINDYFDNLQTNVADIPPNRILNYDETNLTDDPGSQKCIFRRGIKYPERVMNSTKTSVSVMFAASADGKVLPPYVVYKAERIYDGWRIGGPAGTRYNRTKSGWFDQYSFEDWFITMILPWAKSLDGPKVLIGDNLSSHLNMSIIRECQRNNIRFIFLPSNSTHITQPLDISFFKPLKVAWRRILTNYKLKNPRDCTINKNTFPHLLKKLMADIKIKETDIIKSGFKAAGIYPFNREEVLKRLPNQRFENTNIKIDETLLNFLKENRSPTQTGTPKRKKMVRVEPGKSVCCDDFLEPSSSKKKKPDTTPACLQERNRVETENDSIEEDAIKTLLADEEKSEQGYELRSPETDDDDESLKNSFVDTDKTDSRSTLDIVRKMDFILVALAGKKKYKHFVARVVEKEEDCCTVKFLRRTPANKFYFPNIDDVGTVFDSDVVAILPMPKTSSSSRQVFSFDGTDFTKYNLV